MHRYPFCLHWIIIHILLFFSICILADQAEDRFSRRSLVRLGVRVIHKITSEAKAQPIVNTNPTTLSKSLRLRLSPKALKLTNKFTTSIDENDQPTINGGGAMSRIDIEKRSQSTESRQSNLTKVNQKFNFIKIYKMHVNSSMSTKFEKIIIQHSIPLMDRC